jgi:hypothetical protein
MIPTVAAIATRAGSGTLISRSSNNTSAAITTATDAAVLITCSPITSVLTALANRVVAAHQGPRTRPAVAAGIGIRSLR